MEKKQKFCKTFDTAKSKVNTILEKYGERQVNLQSEAARNEVCEEIMVSVAELNQTIFAEYIETVRFQAEMNNESTPFDDQRRVILSDALWLEETGGFTGLDDEEKQVHREEVLKACAEQAGMVKAIQETEPVGEEGDEGEMGKEDENEQQ